MRVLLLLFTKVLGGNDKLQKDSLHKSHVIKVVSDLTIMAHEWSKFAPQKKGDFWVFASCPAVHSGVVSRWRAVAVGVSDL